MHCLLWLYSLVERFYHCKSLVRKHKVILCISCDSNVNSERTYGSVIMLTTKRRRKWFTSSLFLRRICWLLPWKIQTPVHTSAIQRSSPLITTKKCQEISIGKHARSSFEYLLRGGRLVSFLNLANVLWFLNIFLCLHPQTKLPQIYSCSSVSFSWLLSFYFSYISFSYIVKALFLLANIFSFLLSCFLISVQRFHTFHNTVPII